jgi:pantoate--beta-alanine ligase
MHATLQEVVDKLQEGRRDFSALSEAGLRRLEAAGFQPQYLEIRAPDLHPPVPAGQAFVVLAAAYLGRTRLIDNVKVS